MPVALLFEESVVGVVEDFLDSYTIPLDPDLDALVKARDLLHAVYHTSLYVDWLIKVLVATFIDKHVIYVTNFPSLFILVHYQIQCKVDCLLHFDNYYFQVSFSLWKQFGVICDKLFFVQVRIELLVI